MPHRREALFLPAMLIAGFALLSPSLALAAKAPAKPAVKKPAAKKPAVPARPPVLGTQQLKGDQAQIGVTYTLGKENPMNVTVTAVRYSVERMSIGERRYVPKADEKLLVIGYTLHNPQKEERLARYDTVSFTAIDSKDVNHEYACQAGMPESGEDMDMMLKPGQKKRAFTYVVVPTALSIPKLVVKSSDDLVLRYDLRGKIKPLAAPFADPKDTTGATALAVVPAQLSTPFQIGDGGEATWDVTVEEVAFVEGAVGDTEPEEGMRLLVMTAKVENRWSESGLMRYDCLQPAVVTADDERIPAASTMLLATANRPLDTMVEKGAAARFRMCFQVPKDSKLKSLQVRQAEGGRTYAIDVSGVQ